MSESLMIVGGLLIINVPVYVFIGRIMFSGWDGFVSDFKWNFIPDIVSLLTGRFLKDQKGQLNTQLFVGICLVILFVETVVVKAEIML